MKSHKPHSKTIVFYIYLLCMFLVVPFSLHDAYFDVIQAKGTALQIGMFVTIVLSLIDIVVHRRRLSVHKTDIILLLFAVTIMISSLSSGALADTVTGKLGWYIGSFVLCAGILLAVYFKDVIPLNDIWIPVACVNIFLFALSIFHAAEIDIFHLHEDIRLSQYHSYFSLFGNANWLAGYLSLVLPILFFRYVEEEQLITKSVYAISLILGSMNVLLANSDGLYLGAGIAFAVVLTYCLKDLKKYRSLFMFPVVIGVFGLLLTTLPIFTGKTASLDGITAFLCWKEISVLLIVIGSAMFYLPGKVVLSDRMCKVMRVLIITAIIGGLLFMACDMLIHLQQYNYSWGNNRLRIWKETMYAYLHFLRPSQKLFGIGPELQAGWYGYMNLELKTTVIATHCEPLQLLFTTGAVGLGHYLTVIVSMIHCFLQQEDKRQSAPYFAALAGYIVQALVNSMSPLNAGMFFVVFAMYMQTLNIPKHQA